jgi:hypothetical protein
MKRNDVIDALSMAEEPAPTLHLAFAQTKQPHYDTPRMHLGSSGLSLNRNSYLGIDDGTMKIPFGMPAYPID